MARRPARSSARGRVGELLEEPWQRQVVELGTYYGWRSYHTHDSRRSAPGFPDLVMVRAVELLFVELKTDSGRLTREQRDWRDALLEVATTVRLVATRAEREGIATHFRRPAGGTVTLADATREDYEARLEAIGIYPAVEYHVWRPRDFDDVVHPRLSAGRRRVEPINRPC